mmetsp:Transcript_10762/g.48848  ORF Transcript_10762/g.48848 Transcript_10762/m.48848 type:complete len:430 (+) Transcript_10762:1353-2642(+)
MASLAIVAVSLECCESSFAADLESVVQIQVESNGRALELDLTTLAAKRTPPSSLSIASNALTSCVASSSSSSLRSSSSLGSKPSISSPSPPPVWRFTLDLAFSSSKLPRYSSSASMSSSPGPRAVSQSSASRVQRMAGTRPHPSSSSSSPTVSAIFSQAAVASDATNKIPSLPRATDAATRTAGVRSSSNACAPRAAMTMDPLSAARAASHAARAFSFSGNVVKFASFRDAPSTAARSPATCHACAVVTDTSAASLLSSRHARAARSIRSSARIARFSVSGFSATETLIGCAFSSAKRLQIRPKRRSSLPRRRLRWTSAWSMPPARDMTCGGRSAPPLARSAAARHCRLRTKAGPPPDRTTNLETAWIAAAAPCAGSSAGRESSPFTIESSRPPAGTSYASRSGLKPRGPTNLASWSPRPPSAPSRSNS